MGRFRFELATQDEDAELRYLLAATPMAGKIAVTLRREPSFFDAALVDGTFRQIVICRDEEAQRIVGFGSRSVRELYVNGQPTPIGYLSMLRVAEQYRNLGLVARGYQYLRHLHTDGRTQLYLTTIAEGNERALSLLTSGRAGLPRYSFAGKYHTVALPIAQRVRTKPASRLSIDVRPATNADLEEVLEFLARTGPARQFFPTYRADDFFTSQGTFKDLSSSDLLLAFRHGRLVGTLGGWDQHRFRQTVVEGYDQPLRWARLAYNGWARLRGLPLLPHPGESLRYLMGVLPVVANDDQQVFAVLLETLLARSAASRWNYLLIGLHESDSLLPLVRRRGITSYVTHMYHACWGDGEYLRTQLDARTAYLELGCL